MNQINNKWPKDNPYKVPADYFDDLYLNIIDRKQKQGTTKTYSIYHFAVAACMLLVCSITAFYLVERKPAECLTLSCVSNEQLEELANKIDYNTLVDYVAEQPQVEQTEELESYLNELDEYDLMNTN